MYARKTNVSYEEAWIKRKLKVDLENLFLNSFMNYGSIGNGAVGCGAEGGASLGADYGVT